MEERNTTNVMNDDSSSSTCCFFSSFPAASVRHVIESSTTTILTRLRAACNKHHRVLLLLLVLLVYANAGRYRGGVWCGKCLDGRGDGPRCRLAVGATAEAENLGRLHRPLKPNAIPTWQGTGNGWGLAATVTIAR